MGTRLRIRFVSYSILWISGTVILFAAFDISSLDLLYIVSLSGFLATVEVTAPAELSLPWRKNVLWVTMAAISVFFVIVVRAMIRIIPERYLPLDLVGVIGLFTNSWGSMYVPVC